MKISRSFFKKWNIWIYFLLAAVRIWIAIQTPIVAHMSSLFDDQTLINYTKNILSGNWLGDYSHLTLRKSPGYSLFLAISFYIGIPYQALLITFLVLAALFFLHAVKPLVHNEIVQVILYAGIIYSPNSFTYRFLQATYRMGVIVPSTMVVFSAYIAIFLYRNQPTKKLIPYGIVGGIGCAIFWFSMESSVWIAPFIVTSSLVLFIVWCTDKNKETASFLVLMKKGCVLAITPLITITAGLGLSSINYMHYGVFLVSDYTQGSFAKLAAEIVRIKANDSDEHGSSVWVTRNAINLAFKNSPTLRTVESDIRKAWDGWAGSDTKELQGDFCWWALRTGYQDAGYFKDAQKTQQFYEKASQELHTAFSHGKLKERTGLFISSSAPPITKNTASIWLKHVGKLSLDLVNPKTILGNVGTHAPSSSTADINSDFDWLTFVRTASSGRVAGVEGDSTNQLFRPILRANLALAALSYISWFTLASVGIFAAIQATRQRRRKTGEMLLCASGLILSGAILIMGVSWFVEFFWTSSVSGESSVSIAGYGIGFYPVWEMFICIVAGFGLSNWIPKSDTYTICQSPKPSSFTKNQEKHCPDALRV